MSFALSLAILASNTLRPNKNENQFLRESRAENWSRSDKEPTLETSALDSLTVAN